MPTLTRKLLTAETRSLKVRSTRTRSSSSEAFSSLIARWRPSATLPLTSPVENSRAAGIAGRKLRGHRQRRRGVRFRSQPADRRNRRRKIHPHRCARPAAGRQSLQRRRPPWHREGHRLGGLRDRLARYRRACWKTTASTAKTARSFCAARFRPAAKAASSSTISRRR